MRPARSFALLPFGIALAISAHAARAPEGGPRAEIRPAAAGIRLATLSRPGAFADSPAWRNFRGRHGAWTAQWNERTGSPHRAFGPSIRLPGAADDAVSVDRSVRAFVAGNPELFGTPALETVSTRRVRDTWYARYRQTIGGVPVVFSDWEFRVGRNGRLVAFGADAHAPRGAVATRGQIVRAVAREAARQGLGTEAANASVQDGGTWLLPLATESGTEYRLVYEERVVTSDPPGNWWTLVDAENGTVLWRHDRIRYNIGGHVTAQIHPVTPSDPLSTVNLSSANVVVGSTTVATNASGVYSAAATGTVSVTSRFVGTWCAINNQLPPNAVQTVSATDPSTVDFAWTGGNSHDAERDAFYHVNRVHDFIKSLDPSFTGMDYQVPTAVNINQTCNAFWDGFGINFFRQGGGCANTALIADVIYHEYGHGINDNVYIDAGSGAGMLNGALHEGLADVNAALFQDNPQIGKGFGGASTFLRTVDNANRWPDNASGDPHLAGLIIAGAFWDLREAVGLSVARDLQHYAKYGTPDDNFDDGVAMSEYFVETLVADDNDANLGNGTPHFTQIVNAFNAHGIGTGFFIDFVHAPLADQPGVSNYPVTATITYDGPVGALAASSPTLHYSINGASYVDLAMAATANPNEFTASIPGQPAGIVRYYISAADVYGGTNISPVGAPSRTTYLFLAGPASTVFLQNMESDPGWVVGAPGDAATTGVWTRANPNGTLLDGIQVAPEDDHTAGASTIAWVTGNGISGENPSTSDIDGGKTTLTTNVFNATAVGIFPVIEYYRWYTNDLGGAPGTDYWRTYISNDGGANYVPVENTIFSDNNWQRVLLFVHDYVTPTSNMRMRFVAQDSVPPSLVEAGVDDFRLLSYPPTAAVGDGAASTGRLALAAMTPNPLSTRGTLHYTLPASGRATLRIFDLAGRAVRTLVDGAIEAGPHAVEWNGRDDAGRRVAAGPYFARLVHGSAEAVRKVMVMR